MRRRPRAGAIALCALAALGVALGGCGEERGTADGGAATIPTATATTPVQPRAAGQASGPAVASVEVSLTEYRLEPASPRVARGGVIAFAATNDGAVVHALAVAGPAGEVRSGPLEPGERAVVKARLPPGTYKWYCPLDGHERLGMTGRVRVAE